VEGARRAVAETRVFPVTAVAPAEGRCLRSGFVIPKNSPNKDGAYAYLDAMLDKSAQEAFAVDMGYNPTVTTRCRADLNQRIGFTPTRFKNSSISTTNHMNKNDVPFKGMVGQGAEELRVRCSPRLRIEWTPLFFLPSPGGGPSRGEEKNWRNNRWPRRLQRNSIQTKGRLVALSHDAGRAGDGVRGRRLIVPLAILFRYSFNSFEPRRMMVETFTLGQYVKFSPILLHRRAWTTLRVAALCTVTASSWVCRSLTCGAHPVAVQRMCYHAGGAAAVRRNAVRAAWVDDPVRLQGFLNVTLMQFGVITEPLQIMYTRAPSLPHHCRQSALHGADLAERDRSINRNVEEAAFSLGAGDHDVSFACCCRCRARHPAGTILTFILGMNAYATLSCSAAPNSR